MYGSIDKYAGGGANVTMGAIEAYAGYQGLKNLNKNPFPLYSISPELQNSYNRAQGLADQGFTGAETANFEQNVAEQENTGYRQGVQMSGGNLAGAISAGLGAQRLNSFNQFAGQDASLHRQNIHYADTLSSALQSQKNLIQSAAIQRRNQLEGAYGKLMGTGLTNVSEGFTGGSGGGKSGGATGGFGGGGGGGAGYGNAASGVTPAGSDGVGGSAWGASANGAGMPSGFDPSANYE